MSTTTKRAPAAPKALPHNALIVAIWTDVKSRAAVVEAFKAAGAEDEGVKIIAQQAYMARRLYPDATECTAAMLKNAQHVIDLPNSKSKATEKRTEEQDKFCGGMRQYLFSIRAAAGVNASDNRGGANNTGPRVPDGATPEPAAGEKYETELDVRKHLMHVGATLLAFVEKHNAITSPATRKVVDTFVKSVNAWAPKPATK